MLKLSEKKRNKTEAFDQLWDVYTSSLSHSASKLAFSFLFFSPSLFHSLVRSRWCFIRHSFPLASRKERERERERQKKRHLKAGWENKRRNERWRVFWLRVTPLLGVIKIHEITRRKTMEVTPPQKSNFAVISKEINPLAEGNGVRSSGKKWVNRKKRTWPISDLSRPFDI